MTDVRPSIVDLHQLDEAGWQKIEDAADGGVPALVLNATTAEARERLAAVIGLTPDEPEPELVVCSTPDGATRLVIPLTARTSREQLFSTVPMGDAPGTVLARQDGAYDAYAPVVQEKVDWVDERGRIAISKHLAVGREIRKEGDRFHALVHDSVRVAPDGLDWHKEWRATVLDSVTLGSVVRSDATVTRSAQVPPTDSRTDITVQHSRSQTIGFSVAAGREVGAGAGSAGPELTAKSSLSFVFNWSRKTERSMQWSLKDYTLENSLTEDSVPPVSRKTGATTTKLSPAIALDAAYFRSAERLTPAMQRQQVEQISEWIIGGRGTHVWFETEVRATKRSFDGWNTSVRPVSTDMPRRRVVVDLTSPFLSRNQTVHIQSRRTGGLLSGTSEVRLVQGVTPDLRMRQYEWELDELGRYRCRAGAGDRYLTMRDDGKLVLAPASLSLGQQWEWQADRLHCRSNPAGVPGALPFRLVADGGRVRCHAGDAARQYPVNPEHPILAPWSSYPSKPARGDVIPRLDGNLPEIPEEWVTAGYQVLPEEQWQVIVVRQGLGAQRAR